MILGIGTDLVDIRRIEHSLLRFGDRFENRVFTKAEIEYANKSATYDIHAVASIYAKRFAAKEACAKALGTGMASGIAWKDIEVTKTTGGAVGLRLSGEALAKLHKMAPAGVKPVVFLSLADEYPYAQAHVIISAVAAI